MQKLGTALSNMVMPNIGAFIAWGLITALFIEQGWLQAIFSSLKDPDGWVAKIGGWGAYDGAGIVGPMITYLLPVLIGYTGGRMIHGNRGAVVGAIATMGVVAGADVPMFMGAMIMGPLGGWTMKKLDALWEGKIRPGFEMLVDNFSAGILGMLLAIFGFFGIGPIVSAFTRGAGNAVDFLVNNDLLPLTSILHRTGEGAVPQQRDQPRRADPAGHHPGAGDRQVDPVPAGDQPRPRPGNPVGVHAVRQGRGPCIGPRRRHHPVLRRHPRDLLPVRA